MRWLGGGAKGLWKLRMRESDRMIAGTTAVSNRRFRSILTFLKLRYDTFGGGSLSYKSIIQTDDWLQEEHISLRSHASCKFSEHIMTDDKAHPITLPLLNHESSCPLRTRLLSPACDSNMRQLANSFSSFANFHCVPITSACDIKNLFFEHVLTYFVSGSLFLFRLPYQQIIPTQIPS